MSENFIENNSEDDDAINEEIILDENEMGDNDENIEDFREKVRKSGVIYLSNIPEGMTVTWLRERLQTYGVTRIYLTPQNINSKGKKRLYKEGWCEFSNKLMGKLCEYELNGEVIGGKRNLAFNEDIWTIKYLHKFKWHHLIEKMNYNKKLRDQRLKAEISQARREANFIEDKFEQSKIINKKRKRLEQAQKDEESGNIEDKIDERFKSLHHSEIIKSKKGIKQRQPIIK